MARVLVTGGAGFIGSHLVEALVARGDEVCVLDNLSTGYERNLAPHGDKVQLIRGDVSDPEQAAVAVEGCSVVWHQAALASVPLSIEKPLEVHAACATGTLVMLDAARRAGVKRFVYAASSSCYGNQPGDPETGALQESVPTMPLSPYAAAKLAGELYLQSFYHSYGLETVGLRYFNVFGPRQDPSSPYAAVIPLFIKAIKEGRSPTIFGDGLQSRDFVYVGNVVHANLLAAEAPNVGGQVFNIGNGGSTTLLQLIETLNTLLGKNIQPIHAEARVGDVRHSRADITNTQDKLSYTPPVRFEEGLRRLLLSEGLIS